MIYYIFIRCFLNLNGYCILVHCSVHPWESMQSHPVFCSTLRAVSDEDTTSVDKTVLERCPWELWSSSPIRVIIQWAFIQRIFKHPFYSFCAETSQMERYICIRDRRRDKRRAVWQWHIWHCLKVTILRTGQERQIG
jgi:hypothetical protein